MLRIQSSKKKEILDIVELKKGVVRVNKNLFKSSKTVRNDWMKKGTYELKKEHIRIHSYTHVCTFVESLLKIKSRISQEGIEWVEILKKFWVNK